MENKEGLHLEQEGLRLGVDIGSTTVKVVVTDQKGENLLYSAYRRHNARQIETAAQLLQEVTDQFPDISFQAAVCGSGGKPAAQAMGVPYIQEVVANAAAVCKKYPRVRTAIELGGQDAKVVFFRYDAKQDALTASDMRMNGNCAGGTGAFIDEIASLLDVKPEDFEALAEKGTHIYDISGRCGVFAKTDIQPLLIQGAKREDIALSSFHAIAKQTIGGLSQGLELAPPIIFEGGPLTFHPTLIRVFAQRLHLRKEDIIIPEHPETIVAYGAAIAADQIRADGQIAPLATAAELRKHLIQNTQKQKQNQKSEAKPFFSSQEDRLAFETRHKQEIKGLEKPQPKDGVLNVFLGIDSGSTTSKFVLLDDQERIIDRFYANNHGEPLKVICQGLTALNHKYQEHGIKLNILGTGTTGYGEQMFAKAFNADYHVVETVAHAQGCLKYEPDATFILDIGGQDMKAIWIKDGVITNIMLNEACSSGCGSFLENFAVNLNIPVEKIADAAFRSQTPASLGSRCTVFMNSSIINEQRNGRNADDIMAGLCRSIIANVFTKVVRISNTNELGDHVVVQGGTFRNLAVLRAIEEYLQKDVTLAPYPGEMGAVGAAILTKQHMEEEALHKGQWPESTFIGLDTVEHFKWQTQTGVACPHCANHCSRTIMTFPGGQTWITGNRCERGGSEAYEESLASKATVNVHLTGENGNSMDKNTSPVDGNANPANTGKSSPAKNTGSKDKQRQRKKAEDLFEIREKLLFRNYPCQPVRKDQKETIGIPRVLEFWDSAPFWSTFLRALGYQICFSDSSSQKMYEKGLTFVASDTICFPAKLTHGHIINLAEKQVDRIFMPYVMHMPPEGTDKKSPYVCAVLQGYPMVIKNSQDPATRYQIPFDTPIFHFFSEKDRKKQICDYAQKELGASKQEALDAFHQAQKAQNHFRKSLENRAKKILERVKKEHTYAVVLAGRPYHTDPFISHGISKKFTEKEIPVLTVDSLPGRNQVDLSNTRIEITNDFHTRMLEGAVIAADTPELEYVQIVSFGCGHDAVLSDEITRIMTEKAGKPPLILKLDESTASGSIGIRIQSFTETVKIRRKQKDVYENVRPLPSPSPAKFYKSDKKTRTLLIPNISPEVDILLKAILEKENFKVKTIPLGSEKQIALGKKYVHNDICFPCQMVIGEAISELQKGNYKQDEVAVGMVKFQCDCRLSHYAGLLRKGLDAAGFTEVPVVTTDVGDTKDMHPGVYLINLTAVIDALWIFLMLDILTDLTRKIRPYEKNKGETDRVYQASVRRIAKAIKGGIGTAKREFAHCIDRMNQIPYDRSTLKPRALVTGELLVTYHEGSNFHIERYLEKNGMEAIFPRVTDQLRKDFQATMREITDYGANIFPYPYIVEKLFNYVQGQLDQIACRHPLYQKPTKPSDLYKGVKDIIPETLSCGEGWLMAAEIDHYAREGVKCFVILQPFGCLPNHICGRGVIKKLKERYPDINILPLDLDPDTSYANVENRLQMLIMSKGKT